MSRNLGDVFTSLIITLFSLGVHNGLYSLPDMKLVPHKCGRECADNNRFSDSTALFSCKVEEKGSPCSNLVKK